MYFIYAQLYWPVWLIFEAYGQSAIGIFAGVVAVICVWAIAWRVEFGTWKLGF